MHQVKPTFLVTNDDGIHVYFIRAIAEALSVYGTVFVAAPAREQSWVGKGVSRHRDVSVKDYGGFPGIEAWEVDGTPSDAVNIALGHLLPHKPDVVVSGINIGWNAMVPVLFSSGTIAGALEGASWGLPAVALSHHLAAESFNLIKEDPVNPPAHVTCQVDQAASLSAEFCAKLAGKPNEECLVYNVNFPTKLKPDTPWINTQPGHIKLGSLFQRNTTGTYSFRHQEQSSITTPVGLPSDFNVFSAGKISLSKLNFSNLTTDLI